jgi:SAM-dependent methyltransferase
LRLQQRRYRIQHLRVGTTQFGSLRRVSPISRVFGLDRGLPIDRYYIEQFLLAHRSDVRGRVLEMGDDFYTRKFGQSNVARADILDLSRENSKATIVADLTCAENIQSDTYDCIICTQTLQMIYQIQAALTHLHRILKPGGVLLLTAHGISRIARREGVDPWGEYWHFTSQALRRLFNDTFLSAKVELATYGNVLAAIALLHGLATEELDAQELNYRDPDYEVLIAVRAVKPGATL